MAAFAPSPVVITAPPVAAAAPATAGAPEETVETATTETPDEEREGAEWPDEAIESAMRAEQREREGDLPPEPKAPPAADRAADDEPTVPLPKLDQLIEQIPAEVRETLEDLFRARFTSVQRVPKTALK